MEEKQKKASPWRFAFLALAIWGVLQLFPGIWGSLLVLWFQLKANTSPNDAVSVGIIGGADGPTAIFLTTPGWAHYVLPVLAAVVGIVGYIKLKKTE